MKSSRFYLCLFTFVLLSACSSGASTPTLTHSPTLLPTVTVIPETPTAIPTATPTVKVVLQPETVGCLSKDLCYGIEPVNGAALYKQATEALLMGPANDQYFKDFGLANATYEQRMKWLRNSMHVNPNTGENEGYWLPDKSPKGTEFMILQNNGQEFGLFHASVAMQKAGGMRLDDIELVVFGPDAYKENRGGVKDLFAKIVAENTNFNGAYGPLRNGVIFDKSTEIFGLATVDNGEKVVFIAGNALDSGGRMPPSAAINTLGSGDTSRVAASMFELFYRVTDEWTVKQLKETGPYLDIAAGFMTNPPIVPIAENPADFVGPKVLFEPVN